MVHQLGNRALHAGSATRPSHPARRQGSTAKRINGARERENQDVYHANVVAVEKDFWQLVRFATVMAITRDQFGCKTENFTMQKYLHFRHVFKDHIYMKLESRRFEAQECTY
jgi:hypothetical protein